MFWFDRVALLLHAAPEGEWLLGRRRVRLAPGDVAARREAAGQLLRELKGVPDAERRRQVDALESQLGMHVPAGAVPERSAMDWGEVAEMAEAGIEFGSHTQSHPILSRLDDAALDQELRGSREEIERRLGRPVHTIAYPVGKAGAYDERVMAAARRSGYRLGISYETGVNDVRRMDRFDVRRLAVERYTAWPFFQGLMAFPALLG
jgi:peptidoglycan/xylan/chitin deacetylase (PgdA/CDA1 family)